MDSNYVITCKKCIRIISHNSDSQFHSNARNGTRVSKNDSAKTEYRLEDGEHSEDIENFGLFIILYERT